mmetsp:Transcript_19320/g.31250  ORF Transcript_19320/g.31250 Transcript_19320/m.31250 type:complete len:261 (-) Transcript_19320:84-866(-)
MLAKLAILAFSVFISAACASASATCASIKGRSPWKVSSTVAVTAAATVLFMLSKAASFLSPAAPCCGSATSMGFSAAAPRTSSIESRSSPNSRFLVSRCCASSWMMVSALLCALFSLSRRSSTAASSATTSSSSAALAPVRFRMLSSASGCASSTATKATPRDCTFRSMSWCRAPASRQAGTTFTSCAASTSRHACLATSRLGSYPSTPGTAPLGFGVVATSCGAAVPLLVRRARVARALISACALPRLAQRKIHTPARA